VGHRAVERGAVDRAGQVPLQRRGDVRRLLPHHVPHRQLPRVVLLSALKDCEYFFHCAMEGLVSEILGDALARMSYHVLSCAWSCMNYVWTKLRGVDHDQESSIENVPLIPRKKRDYYNSDEVVVNIQRR